MSALLGPATEAMKAGGSPLGALVDSGFVKALLPVPALALVLPFLWLLFRKSWAAIDKEGHEERAKFVEAGRLDLRPAVALILTAVVLTMHDYYGGRAVYNDAIRPFLERRQAAGWSFIKLETYDSLWSYGWWSFARVAGYVLVPLPVYKLLFRKESLLDLGFRVRGIKQHLWLYGASLALVIVCTFVVARAPDFAAYYPFYKLAGRSRFDLLAWEAMYFAQFFALEIFFRGFLLSAMRSLGATAIVVMCVPYCMIHYGKPYLEANGAILAGIFLGSLAMRAKSIYGGFVVHVTVALGMDLLALHHRGGLPKQWFP